MLKKKPYGDGIHDDTVAIQSLLDKGGYISIPDGKYLITHPLIIHSDTHLKLSRFAYFQLADNANCSLLDNDGLYTKKANNNIIIEGGIWDGNHSMQERKIIPDENLPCDEKTYISNELLVLLMRLVHTRNLVIKNITFKNPTSYALHVADTEYFKVENIILDFDLTKPNMDGVHIQGPARFGKISNISGNANDDHIALCANGTTRSEITRGNIEDIDIDGVYCDNGYTGVRLLSCGDAVRNISIRNIHGQFRFYAVSFTHHYPLRENQPPLLENIHISDIYASKSIPNFHKKAAKYEPLVWFENGTNCKNVVIHNIFRDEKNPETLAPTVIISEDANVQNLTISDISETFVGEKIPTVKNLSKNTINIK